MEQTKGQMSTQQTDPRAMAAAEEIANPEVLPLRYVGQAHIERIAAIIARHFREPVDWRLRKAAERAVKWMGPSLPHLKDSQACEELREALATPPAPRSTKRRDE